MTTSERIRYIKTVITVSTKSPHKEKYDRLIDAHRRLFSTGIYIVFSLLLSGVRSKCSSAGWRVGNHLLKTVP